MSTDPRPLTPRELEVLALVDHYQAANSEPAPAAHVARKLGISRQRVCDYFRSLSELGWLRAPGAPAFLRRPAPVHEALTKTQVPTARRMEQAPVMAKRSAPAVAGAVPQMIEMGPLVLRAEVRADRIDKEARTAEVVFSTGAAVERFDWWTGKRYVETLSLEPGHVRLKRINNSAPLLDAHSSYELRNQIGVVVPKSARIENGEATATVRFSKRVDVEPLFQDVVDGIVRNVSVGYKVHTYEKTDEEGKPEFRHAVDWEPYEISAVPMGADDGAKFRGQKPTDTNPCQIVTRAEEPAPPQEVHKKEPRMEDPRPETIMEPTERPTERTPAPVRSDPQEPNERDAGVAAERARVAGIRNACLSGRMPRSFEDKLIKDGVALVDAQNRVFDELRNRTDPTPQTPNPNGGRDVYVGDDPLVHKRKGIENALLHRLAPEAFKLDDVGREYRGMGLLDIAEVFLRARDIRITSMSKMERAAAALGMSVRAGGMHTTSDFPLLLADVANKVLRAAYEAAPQTWVPISKAVSLSDFKASKQLQVGDAPQLLEVLEHGEFTQGTITEAKEQIQLKTYGRIFAITRQSLINDDTNAFAEVPASFGRAARTRESDLAWAQITSNPNMGDGVALFHTATHKNLSATSDAIAVASIGAGRASMRSQTAIDGVTLINLSPNFLIVPAAKETIADQFVSVSLMASAPGSINPFAGRLQVISEPRLDANSVTAWYLATNPAQSPVLLHGTLDGQTGPQVDQEIGFDVDGLKIKCRLDVAFKAADWRGIFKNPGA